MVRITQTTGRGKVYLKILFWGIKGAGKSTVMDLLYNIIKETEMKEEGDFRSTGELNRIPVGHDEGSYFARGIFQSTKIDTVFFHVYTLTTEPDFDAQMIKNVFMGTDGIIFVFDSQRDRWEENVESLKVLKANAGDDLIKKIPLIVLLNKADLENAVTVQEVEELIQQEGLSYPHGHDLEIWNPVVYPSTAVLPTDKNLYNAFTECARRVGLYWTFGGGASPKPKKTARIDLVIPEALKNKWERFSSDVVHTSMSKMIRDAVKEYIKKMKQTQEQQDTIPEDQEDQALEKKIERTVVKKLEDICRSLLLNI